MAARSRLVVALPWLLCAASLTMLIVGVGLGIAFPQDTDRGPLYALLEPLGFFLVPPVGALIASRLPSNPYGWLWSALGLAYGLLALAFGLWRLGAVPGWAAGTFIGATYLTLLGLLAFVLLLFPTGRLPGPRWRWPARLAVVVVAAGIVLLPLVPTSVDGAGPSPWAQGGATGRVL